MKFKGAIFDLDGTLLNTIDDLSDSMNAVLNKYGFKEHSVKSYCYYIGMGLKHFVKESLPEKERVEQKLQKYLDELNEEYSRRWWNKTKLYDGIEQVLDELERKKIPKAILSNKPNEFTQIICKKYFSKWDFKYIYGSFPDVPRKPNPYMTLKIVKDLNMSVDDFIYFGDSWIDMKNAKAANMYAVGCLWGFREAEELIEYGADKLIDKPIRILDFY